MELKAHFSDIHRVIIHHLEQASSEIIAAVAWFTDRDIFEVLCKKAHAQTKITIALIGDEINQAPGGLNFQRLEAAGGRVIFLPAGSREEPIMHHKFCVIDRSVVITGSYNWSRKARSNDENITVVTDSPEFAQQYIETFDNLLNRNGHGKAEVPDLEAVKRRLELIRNLILLGEQEDVTAHVHKLRPLAGTSQIFDIIKSIDNRQYKAVVDEINLYLSRVGTLVLSGLTDIARLRLVLQTLELRLESISDEKAELERRLMTFNQRHDKVLGDVILRILKARTQLAALRVKNKKYTDNFEDATIAARDAEEAYAEYLDQQEELRRTPTLPELNAEAERQLKSLYRKACSLCHPDKFPDDEKESAHRAFVALQEAYKANSLERVRSIHDALRSDSQPQTRSATLTEVDTLNSAISELECAIEKLVYELNELRQSDAVLMMESAGVMEVDWQRFFEMQRNSLEQELKKIESAVLSETSIL